VTRTPSPLGRGHRIRDDSCYNPYFVAPERIPAPDVICVEYLPQGCRPDCEDCASNRRMALATDMPARAVHTATLRVITRSVVQPKVATPRVLLLCGTHALIRSHPSWQFC
jgi:hypothetical protein